MVKERYWWKTRFQRALSRLLGKEWGEGGGKIQPTTTEQNRGWEMGTHEKTSKEKVQVLAQW
jgi:hypothetical protein